MAKLYFDGPSSAFLAVPAVRDVLPLRPSQSSRVSVQPRMLRAQFGNGYSQRAKDGINNSPLRYQVVFANRKPSLIKEVKDFLLGGSSFYNREAHEYFYMKAPAPFDASFRKWVLVGECEVSFGSGALQSISFNLEEVFDP